MMRSILVACAMAAPLMPVAWGGDVAVEENFNAGTVNWFTGANNTPGYQATGGADGGGYLESNSLTFADNFASPPFSQAPPTATLFRGHEEFGSSSGAFVGNWIELGYTELSFFVRHNAPLPVQFSARLANGLTNSPGASVADLQQFVLPNEWTEVVLDVSRDSDDIISFGGATGAGAYEQIFSNVGNIQIFANQPFGLTAEQTMLPLSFELDMVSVSVPEPPALLLIGTAVAAFGLRWRSRGACL